MLATKRALTLEQPYPGLRSFEPEESLLFHGRNVHTEELLRRLAVNRFLAVVGGSGSGKSSLVRAGLLPALYRGYLVGATSKWRIAVMRPGSSPIDEMAKALAAPEALGAADPVRLRESSFGLVNTLRASSLSAGECLLLVVDQFEELFRFRRESSVRDGGAEAALFVSQLLQAADEFGAPIYVALTMRSDFLGECAQFPGLPEALNKGQYLIPRMTREQRREAIVDALDLFDVAMSDRLVQRLLNDAGDDPDQLPVLQHALQQTYRLWVGDGRQGEIDLDHYQRAGTMGRALNDHAQRVYDSIPEEHRWMAERLFRSLTKSVNGRAVRRPAKLERLLRVIGVADDPLYAPAAVEIIKLFASRENCFLVFGGGLTPDSDSVVDISHESLIRKWKTLGDWVRDEAKSVDAYRYLRRDTGMYPAEAGLWADPDLSGALKCRSNMGWNADWAEQYHDTPGATYEQVEHFLDLCVKEREAKQKREARLKWLKWGLALLVLALTIGGVQLYRLELENRESASERRRLEEQTEALSRDTALLKQRGQQLEDEISNARKAAAQSPNDAKATAEVERLRKEQELATKSLKERESLISQNQQQVAQVSQDYSSSLERINDLQRKLREAWDERDRAKNELAAQQKTPSKGSAPIATTPVERIVQAVPPEPLALRLTDNSIIPLDRAPFRDAAKHYYLVVPGMGDVKAASSLAIYLLSAPASIETFTDRDKQMNAFLKQAGLSNRSCASRETAIRTDWTKGPADVVCFRVTQAQAGSLTGQILGAASLDETSWEAVFTANSNMEIPASGPSKLSLVIHFRQVQSGAKGK